MAVARRTLLASLVPLFAPVACGAADRRPRFAQPLALDLPPGARLEPLGALVLDTAGIGLGGLSGLHLDSDLRLSAVSDRGRWMTGRLVLENGRLDDLRDVRHGPLRDGAG
ncbi:MAG: esterase-like activity of phytase family protein, partial [Acetobacteraceae bacterium]|nr:esterase-like activity of phytase family protein [Acetobacteraceae bacterium]